MDAGNRNARRAGRTRWLVEDWNVACETFERLYGSRVATSRNFEKQNGVQI